MTDGKAGRTRRSTSPETGPEPSFNLSRKRERSMVARPGCISVAVVLSCAAAAAAQPPQQADPVVVTATKTETPASQLGAAVTVITGEDIDTRRYPTVDEALDRKSVV